MFSSSDSPLMLTKGSPMYQPISPISPPLTEVDFPTSQSYLTYPYATNYRPIDWAKAFEVGRPLAEREQIAEGSSRLTDWAETRQWLLQVVLCLSSMVLIREETLGLIHWRIVGRSMAANRRLRNCLIHRALAKDDAPLKLRLSALLLFAHI